MPVPNIDYDNLAGNMLPFRQRKTKWLLFAKGLVFPVKWLNSVFREYMNGNYSTYWSNTITYAYRNRVRYNYKVYESLIPDNIGNVPDENPAAWLLVNNNFIGAIERAKYNGRYLELTYALNRYFNTTFRQPPYPDPYGGGTQFSDIYITNVAPVYASFTSNTLGTVPSKVNTLSSGAYFVFPNEVYAEATSYTFAVWFPIAVYNAIGATDDIRDSVIRGFLDQYVVSGTGYIINTY